MPDLSQYPQPPPSAAQRQAAQAWSEWKVCGWITRWLVHTVAQAKYPDMLINFQDFVAAAQHKRVAVFLDYDGALMLVPLIRG